MFTRHIRLAHDGCDLDFLETGFGPPVGEPAIYGPCAVIACDISQRLLGAALMSGRRRRLPSAVTLHGVVFDILRSGLRQNMLKLVPVGRSPEPGDCAAALGGCAGRQLPLRAAIPTAHSANA